MNQQLIEALGIVFIFICATVPLVFFMTSIKSEYDKSSMEGNENRNIELAWRKGILKEQLEYILKYFPLIIDEAIRSQQNDRYIESLRDTLKIAIQVDENIKKGLLLGLEKDISYEKLPSVA
ncbi:hypothetical protein Q5X61_10655 [Acinetobacter baumannii]|nr:hypothetical protein [Acinetobacter baumannii]